MKGCTAGGERRWLGSTWPVLRPTMPTRPFGRKDHPLAAAEQATEGRPHALRTRFPLGARHGTTELRDRGPLDDAQLGPGDRRSTGRLASGQQLVAGQSSQLLNRRPCCAGASSLAEDKPRPEPPLGTDPASAGPPAPKPQWPDHNLLVERLSARSAVARRNSAHCACAIYVCVICVCV